MNHIRWTDEECQIIAAAAYSLRPPAERNEPNRWMHWCDRAQKNHLPNSRWRALHIGEHTLVRVMPFIRAFQAKPDSAPPTAAAQPTPSIDLPDAPPATLTPQHQLIAETVVNLLEARLLKFLLNHQSQSTDVADAQAIKNLPHAIEFEAPTATIRDSDDMPDWPYKRVPKIAIVGFDSPEQSRISSAIGDRAKLIFATPHHHSSSEKLIQKISSSEVVFVRIKYISHAHTSHLRKKLSNKCRFLENQPNSQKVIQSIQEYLNNHP